MSIYATWLAFDGDDEESPAPVIYQGSHVLPRKKDKRGGLVFVCGIPSYIDRKKRKPPFDWLRLSVREDARTYRFAEEPGDATVLLDREQVTELRDTLTNWLEREADV